MKRLAIVLSLLTSILAACAGDAESPTPSATVAPTAAVESGVASSPTPSGGTPSEEGAGDLAALLPTEVGGIEIAYRYRTGAAVVGSGELTAEAQEFVDAVGADLSDFSMASGIGFEQGFERNVAITAMRVAGADEGELRDAFRRTIENDPSQTLTEATVEGRSVLTMAEDGGESTGYVYVKGDIVFVVGATPLSLADEALATLP